MTGKLVLLLLLGMIFVLPAQAVRKLPDGVQPTAVKGEATGTFSFLGSFDGIGTLTFINTGGVAHLSTVCDMSTVNMAAGERCEGLDLEGSFSGGPYGTAVFTTESGGQIKLQLDDGRVFLYSNPGVSMKFSVSNPSIFDDWIETPNEKEDGVIDENSKGRKPTNADTPINLIVVGGAAILGLVIVGMVMWKNRQGEIEG